MAFRKKKRIFFLNGLFIVQEHYTPPVGLLQYQCVCLFVPGPSGARLVYAKKMIITHLKHTNNTITIESVFV